MRCQFVILELTFNSCIIKTFFAFLRNSIPKCKQSYGLEILLMFVMNGITNLFNEISMFNVASSQVSLVSLGLTVKNVESFKAFVIAYMETSNKES